MMKLSNSIGSLLNVFLGAMMFLFIIFPHLTGVTAAATGLLLIVGLFKKQVVWVTSKIGLLFILLYVVYLIGTIYSNNPEVAYSYLEYKLSFIVFPLLFSLRPKEGQLDLKVISTGLILGVIAAILYGVFNSLVCFSNNGSSSCFLTVIISPIHHPTYFMVFLMTSLFLAWKGFKEKWKYYNLYWIIPFTILIVVLHILSLSLSGMLFFIATVSVLGLYFTFKRFGWMGALIGGVLLPLVSMYVITKAPQVNNEWETAKWYADQYMKDPKAFIKNTEYPMSGSEERLILWTVAYDNLKRNPLGVGTGNVDDVMAKELIQLGQEKLAAKRLNPHNQFLQTGVEIGLIGLFILFSIIIYGIYIAIKFRSALLIMIVMSLCFNSLFESMLQRQSGIVFYTFWICLLAVILTSKNLSLKTEE